MFRGELDTRMSDTAFLTRPPLLRGAAIPWPGSVTTARRHPSAAVSQKWSIPSLPVDDTLGDRIARSDPVAIAQLIGALFSPLTCLARALGPQQRSESELTCVMIAGVLRQVQLRPNRLASLSTWAVKVALRAGLRELKTESSHLNDSAFGHGKSSVSARTALSGAGSNPEAAAQAQALLRTLLSQLPAAHRLIFHLVEVEGWPTSAIAHVTGWPSWLVRWRVFRAQRKFRRLLSRALATAK